MTIGWLVDAVCDHASSAIQFEKSIISTNGKGQLKREKRMNDLFDG
jgi:hypothetical protein